MTKLIGYINSGWNTCVRETPKDEDDILGVPYPYTVPSTEAFNELYYWDTYFTNVGLIKSDKAMLAKNNTDNMLYLVNKYGFMPNGNRTRYLNRSQPPFLSQMVRDLYDYYKDDVWLRGAYDSLKKEYSYWMTKRLTKCGLNGYDCILDECDVAEAAKMFRERVNVEIELDDKNYARHGMVTAESGWDMNPRWELDGYNYAHVDLNSLLYLLETNMSYFSGVLNLGEENLWNERSRRRIELMDELMLDENNLFFDYNFKTGKLSKVFSAASLYPMFAKLATRQQAEAIVSNLHRLEENYGVVCCEKGSGEIKYQWDYPNGWACIQYVAIKALDNYGYIDAAERIAKKYTMVVEKTFEKTGNLWEKYNVVDGSINVQDEYEMPTMFGWSAGIYLAAYDYLNNK